MRARRTQAGPAGRERRHASGGSLTETAVEIIRGRILDLTLAPGTRIDDRLLMKRFGMGRTPAREAFNRLAAEGLITIQRNKGAFVRPLELVDVRPFFDAYAASERLVGFFCRTDDAGLVEDLRAIEEQYEAALAAHDFLEVTRMNAAFHRRIAAATGNEYIHDFAIRLYNHARRLSYLTYLATNGADSLRGMQERIVADHGAVIQAIARNDNDALIDMLTRHARFFHERIMQAVKLVRGFAAPLPAASRPRAATGAAAE